jgi:hypothetical protein
MPTPAEIRQIAMTGTDQQVAALYFELTGTNIKGCVPCQRKDARIHLKIMAKKAQTTALPEAEQAGVNGFTLAPKYASRPTYMFDRLIQLRDEADLKFWQRLAPHVLVKIEATPTPELVTPPADEATQDDANNGE